MKAYDHEILLLQGGGALGAYQAGVYARLVQAGIAPTWVVGISIGGINAALIAGNPPERRVERLREFWLEVSRGRVPAAAAWTGPMSPALSAMSVAALGIPCFFRPRAASPWIAVAGTEAALSFYDTAPLCDTLEGLVDFDLIHRGEVRLSLGAVNVRKGVSVYFDSRTTRITADHVRASGALPPGFPPVLIDGEYYWDGGVVSNTPITYVADQKPMTTARIVQVDNFNAEGELPENIGRAMERAKDIQYASRSRFGIERLREISELQEAARRLIAKLPPALRSDRDARRLAEACSERRWTIIRLINKRPSQSSFFKDCEFSRATVLDAWEAGFEDVARSAAGWMNVEPSKVGSSIAIMRPTEALPLSETAKKRKAHGRKRPVKPVPSHEVRH